VSFALFFFFFCSGLAGHLFSLPSSSWIAVTLSLRVVPRGMALAADDEPPKSAAFRQHTPA